MFRLTAAAVKGRIRALHGVNNGPVAFGGLVDLTPFHEELRFPHVRLHDCNWPGPDVVDVPAVFPLFHADPLDPQNFRFAKTTDYLESIYAAHPSAQVIYRLGTSIEHTQRKYLTDPPSDRERWADICIQIIRHCNEGWAEGRQFGIRYWEIWNEPDNGACMWKGSLEDYCRLYTTAAKRIKCHDPRLKVGGPALAHFPGDYATGFLEHVRRTESPCDFFSFHHYAEHPGALIDSLRQAREILDTSGFEATELHLNEWNYAGASWGSLFEGGESMRRGFAQTQGIKGAAFIAQALSLFQDAPVDVANFYSGDLLPWGLFDPYGVPQKTYHAFRAFRHLLRNAPRRIAFERLGEDPVCLAGMSAEEDRICLLLSAFDAPLAAEINLRAVSAGDWKVDLRALDEELDLEPVEHCAGFHEQILRVDYPRFPAVLLLELTRLANGS